MVADASALIDLEAAGVLEGAADLWRLVATPEVLAEAGPLASVCGVLTPADAGRRGDSVGQGGGPIRSELSGPGVPAGRFLGSPSARTDRGLLLAAAGRNLPLLSDDAKLLMAAELSDLSCLDSFAAIEVLLAAGVIDSGRAEAAAERLSGLLAPSPARLAWARLLRATAEKLRPLRASAT